MYFHTILLRRADKLHALLWFFSKVHHFMRPVTELARVHPVVRVLKWIWKLLLAWAQDCQLPCLSSNLFTVTYSTLICRMLLEQTSLTGRM